MLGSQSSHAEECFGGGFVGVDFGLDVDLARRLPEKWRDFNEEFIPILQKMWPDASKIAAGLACGAIWTVTKGMRKGDIVLCHDGKGQYRIAEIAGDYIYASGEALKHRRPVRWLEQTVARSEMSEPLRRSCGSPGTVSSLSKYADEIAYLIQGGSRPAILVTDENVEDAATFALEKHLEEFLVQNWSSTELGRTYDIYENEGELVGQQFPTDTGPMDILAVSKDRKTLLVVELKRGRATDVVVGQILRYMGFAQDELAEADQEVRGIVIALDDDQRLRRALAVVPVVDFYRYEVSFRLLKG